MENTLRKKWNERAEFLEEHAEELNEWEEGFLDRILVLLSQERSLSMKQSSKLNQIFHRVEEKLG